MSKQSSSLDGQTGAAKDTRPSAAGVQRRPTRPRMVEQPGDRSARRARREGATLSRRAAAAQQAQRRRRLLLGLIPLAIVVVVVAVLIATQTLNTSGLVNADKLNPAGQLLKVGTRAPDFTLSTIDGKPYHLASFKGRPVLLEFFAVWCPHCQRESTVLNQIDSTYGPKGLQTLAVLANPYGRNYDNSGGSDLSIVTKSDITWFEQTFHVTHPTLIDPNFGTVNTYGANSYPTIYVLDKQGIVRYAKSGEQPFSELAAGIDAASK